MSTDAKSQILENLRDDKEYRQAFVAERISARLPLKIRSLRGGRTQKQIAELSSKAQTWISKLEDPNYGKFTLATLLDVAGIYDVGLEVDFVPFSRLLDEITNVTPETFSPVPSFKQEDSNGVFENGWSGQSLQMGGQSQGARELSIGPDSTEQSIGGTPIPPQSVGMSKKAQAAVAGGLRE